MKCAACVSQKVKGVRMRCLELEFKILCELQSVTRTCAAMSCNLSHFNDEGQGTGPCHGSKKKGPP